MLLLNALVSLILMGAAGLVLIHIAPWRDGRTPVCWLRVALAVVGAMSVIVATGTALWLSVKEDALDVLPLLFSMTTMRVGCVMLLASGILRFKRETI